MSKIRIKSLSGGVGSAMSSSAESAFIPIDHLETELREYSITPDTLEYREYERSYDDFVFVESYRYAAQNVLRYGINLAKITREDGILLSSPAALVGGSASSAVVVSVPKDRSSTGASGKYSEAEAKTVKHHSAEIAAFRKAIDSLLDAHDTRVVICDILERDKGVIKDILVSHSVVLHKNPADSSGKHQVAVIDPSNFQHSSHLASEDMIRESASASGLIHSLLSGIKTFHKGTQIYKPFSDNVGSSHSQYRDCVDLAVKLALGLAQSRVDLSFGTIDDIKK